MASKPPPNPSDPPLTPDQASPVDLKVRLREEEIRVAWADGGHSIYPFVYLRKNCPCASCRTERRKKPNPLNILSKAPPVKITVTNAELVGNYALQLTWSDGHNTGIYDFRYLRSIDPAGEPPGMIAVE
jgi:DUF971 family protein